VDPLDGTREFVEGPEFWSGVTVLIGVAVKGVPVAGVIHQPFVGTDGKPAASVLAAVAARAERKAALAAEGWKPKRKTKNPEDDLETFPKGSFGRGRTLWGVPGLGVLSHPGREPHKASPVMKPARADVKNLRVATTRSHPSPFVEGAVYKLYPSVVIRTGGAGGKVALMLDGVVDTWVFPAKGTKRWDTCAGEALLFANRGGWVVRGSDGAAYEYGAAIAEWPGNVDGVIAGADKDLYPWMVHKWPWLNYAGGFRVGPRDAGLE
jgi:3'(2'), 5'-bisphosphate nucleotidase